MCSRRGGPYRWPRRRRSRWARPTHRGCSWYLRDLLDGFPTAGLLEPTSSPSGGISMNVPSSSSEREWQVAQELIEERARRSAGDPLALAVGIVVMAVLSAFFLHGTAGRLDGWWTVRSWSAATAEVADSDLDHSSQWSY